MGLTTLKTFSGLRFDVRPAEESDAMHIAEFWRHVSRTNLAARYVGIENPINFEASGRSSTFLALGGDGAIICMAILLSDAEHNTARVMAFTSDAITSHGVSWALLEYVLAEAQKDGIQTVSSVLAVDDARATRLERQMGFIETDFPGHAGYRLLQWSLGDPAHEASIAAAAG